MSTRNKISGAQLIAKSLQLENITKVFTLAGDHILPVLDVMSDLNFHLVDTRHEQAAAHMADAWGRITGQPGVTLFTTPGLANAVPGIAHAYHSESPMISISGSADLLELGRGAMQEIDQVGMTQPVTKGSWMVTDPRRIPDMIAHAIRTAYAGRRGPVHLTIPVDIQQQSVPEDEVAFFQPFENRSMSGPAATSEQIENVVNLLQSSQRPLLIAGSAAAYADAGDSLQKLIEITKVPLLTEGDARGLVTDDHPYCFGFFDSGLNRAARLTTRADLVILLGRKQDLIIGYAMPPTIPQNAKVIQIDPSAADIGRNRGVAVGIVGDIAAVTDQLTKEASKGSYHWTELPWIKEINKERTAQAEQLLSLTQPQIPMHAMEVHNILGQHLTNEDFLVFDGGDFCHFGKSFLPALKEKSWWYLPTLGMLGSSLPTALAAKLAYPKRRVFLLTGDGSFGFNGMEFDTAVRHQLAIVAILGNDAAWGIDRQIQLGVFGKSVATDLLPTRYDQVVKGLGAHGIYAETPQDFELALTRTISQTQPSLINVQIQGAISPRAEAAISRWNSDAPLPM